MVQIVKNPLILVDGSYYLYRAYHAFSLLINSRGEHTGAMYGVLNILKSLLMQHRPSHMVVVFDSKGKTFRDELFKHYKFHRPTMPDALRIQIDPLYKMVKAMGIPLLAINGIEADDIIGTLSLIASSDGHDVLICTNDKDMAQLVSPKISLINTVSNSILGPKEVQLKFGVPPKLIIDYLALIGDSSDNIPGVPGVGEKTAKALLHSLGGLETLYQQLDKISALKFRGAKTVATKLQQYRDIAFLSYKLATIKTDIMLDLFYDQLKLKEPNSDELMPLLQRYEFKSWLSDLETGKLFQNRKSDINSSLPCTLSFTAEIEASDKVLLKDGYQIIYDIETLKGWVNSMRSIGVFAFGTETRGLDVLTATLVGLYFSVKPGEAAYLPLDHSYVNAPDQLQLDRAAVLVLLKPLLEDASISKISHNLKFDIGILKRYNIELNGTIFDIMLESYVLNSVAGRHDLDSLVDRFLRYTAVNFEKIKHNQPKHNQFALEQTALYTAADADMTLRLHQKIWPCIRKVPELKKVFQEIEMPLVPILSRIERTGVLIDKNMLSEHSIELTKRLEVLELKAHHLAKEPFNLSSTKQLQIILYDKQKLPVLQKTPGGIPSTNEEVLSELALYYPLPKLILEYRNLTKLKSAYIDKLPKMINPVSKRVHTCYHQTITATGRLSSSDPNLQNIPVRNDEGRRIRQAFIAPPDSLILAVDYSQIEMRLIAHLSHDPGLLKIFTTGKDIHSATASEVFGLPLEKVTQEQRRSAKAINFGLIYGMSAFGLARYLSVSCSEAQQYINLYFKRYHGVLNYIKRIRKQAIDQGYVATLDGRRLYFPDIRSDNNIRKKSTERTAINASIQGTAADIIKRAMIVIDGWLQQEELPIRMIMQIHDELVFEVQKDVVEIAKARIKALMEGCFALDVPLQVDIGIGDNWDKAH